MVGSPGEAGRVIEEARALFEEGRDAEAADRLEGVVGRLDAALEADLACLRGDIVSSAGDVVGALVHYENALRRRDGHVPALVGLGKIHLALGSPHEAEEAFGLALAHDPRDPRALLGMGLAARARNEWQEALRRFRRAYDDGADPETVLQQILEVALESGDLEPAIEPLADWADRRPDDAAAAHGLAVLHHRLGNVARARAACDRVLAIDPDHAEALAMRASIESPTPSPRRAPSTAPGAYASARELRDAFFTALFAATQTVQENNWDDWRFEHLRPDEHPWEMQGRTFRPELAAQVLALVVDRTEEIHETLLRLADPASRRWIFDLLLYRALGHRHVRLPTNNNVYQAAWQMGVKSIERFGTRAYVPSWPPRLQDLFHVFRLEFEGRRIEVESVLPIAVWAFFLRQYYLERPGVRVRPEPGDVIIDGGACWGETALAFAASVGERGRIVSIETSPENATELRRNLARNPALAPRVSVVEAALFDEPGRTVPIEPLGIASRVGETPNHVDVPSETVDHLVESERLERVDLIKMDIEGVEPQALRGATATIRRFRPKLAIAAYHRIDDFITLTRLIHEIEPSYRLFVDHYTIDTGETVLYALPPGRARSAG